MARDLSVRLLPPDPSKMDGAAIVNESLTFERQSDLFWLIDKSHFGVEGKIVICRHRKVEVTDQDARGADLCYLTPQDFKRIKVPRKTSKKNRAIISFLKSLPDDIKIILDWA